MSRQYISFAADFIPVLGTIKTVQELMTGEDWFTGEEIPKWVPAVGLAGSFIGPLARLVPEAVEPLEALLKARLEGTDPQQHLKELQTELNDWFQKTGKAAVEKGINAFKPLAEIFNGLKLLKQNGKEFALVEGSLDVLAKKLPKQASKLDDLRYQFSRVVESLAASTGKTAKAIEESGFFAKTGMTLVSKDVGWARHLVNVRKHVKAELGENSATYQKAVVALNEITKRLKEENLIRKRPDMISVSVDKKTGKIKIDIGELKEATLGSKLDTYGYPPSLDRAAQHETPQLDNYAKAKMIMDQVFNNDDFELSGMVEVNVTYIFNNKGPNEIYKMLFNQMSKKTRGKVVLNTEHLFEVSNGSSQYFVMSTDRSLKEKLLK